jgi:hypothetical protein
MSNELERYLRSESNIPWDDAAAYFCAVKEVTKEAKDKVEWGEKVRKAKEQGTLSGIRSSQAKDVTHLSNLARTKGSRVGKEIGTVAGALGGGLLAKKNRALGAIAGALGGRSLGKVIGSEKDKAKILSKYQMKPKKAEMIKESGVVNVRRMWKLAQDSAADEIEGQYHIDQSVPMEEAPPKPKRKSKKQDAVTPESIARAGAELQLQQEAEADQAVSENEGNFYRQIAEEAGMQNQELAAQLQEAQAAIEQIGQQNQAAQMQADQAVSAATMQSQNTAAQNQQLSSELEATSQEALMNKETIMQLRQAMQNYREGLQQMVLTDPTALAGPSPMDQGMPMTPEDQAMAEQEQAAQMGDEQALQAETEQAPPAKPKAKPKAEPKEKTSSMKERAGGAAIGALLSAGLQARTDKIGKGGISDREAMLKNRIKKLQAKSNKGVMDKHQLSLNKFWADVAKTNREHPGSAKAMAALGGAAIGSAIGPTVSGMLRRR